MLISYWFIDITQDDIIYYSHMYIYYKYFLNKCFTDDLTFFVNPTCNIINKILLCKIPPNLIKLDFFLTVLIVKIYKNHLLYTLKYCYMFQHFVCAKCEKPFLGHRHYEKKGLAYCETHYHQLFGNLCFVCNQVIAGDGTYNILVSISFFLSILIYS